jgi:hypothetical protein
MQRPWRCPGSHDRRIFGLSSQSTGDNNIANESISLRRHAAVVMERRLLQSRWATEVWSPVDVVEQVGDESVAPELLEQSETRQRWLHPGFLVELFRDEAEGYYLNLTTERPFAFVEWEMVDGSARPRWVTLSYHEAARRMDGGAQVDGVPMPDAWLPWLAAFTQEHLQLPKKKERIRPASFRGAKRDAP